MFLFPTVAHCGGGYANSSFDLVLPMVRWVEDGTAPSQVTATDTIGGQTVTRPVYPYPQVPMYNGSGPTSDASSFHAMVSIRSSTVSRAAERGSNVALTESSYGVVAALHRGTCPWSRVASLRRPDLAANRARETIGSSPSGSVA